MPSLANIYCHGVPSGLTLTGNLYPDGSDTAAATGLSVTEAANRKTTYVLSAGVTGLHLIHLLSGSNVVWVGWTPPNLAITGDFEACETRREALNLDAKVSEVPAAVRDVSNASPVAGSLGEAINEAATSSTNAVSYITTVMNRLGAFTGTGVNTVLGFLKAIMSKAASTPSDVGGTFSAATDSLEAIKDAGGSGGLTEQNITDIANAVRAANAEADCPDLVPGRRLQIVRGDDYYDADGFPLTVTLTSVPGDLAVDSATLWMYRGGVRVSATSTDVTIESTTLTATFDVGRDKTGQLPKGDGEWSMELAITGGHYREPIQGPLLVIERVGPIT